MTQLNKRFWVILLFVFIAYIMSTIYFIEKRYIPIEYFIQGKKIPKSRLDSARESLYRIMNPDTSDNNKHNINKYGK